MFDRVRKRGASARTTVAAAAAAIALLLGTAPATPAATVPAVVTTQQEVVVTQTGHNSVTVPADATSVRVTLFGAASDDGDPGEIATGNAAISESGRLRPGQTVMVFIASTGTVFGPSIFEPWLTAAGGDASETSPPDAQMFPDATTQQDANTGPGRAQLVFTVPVGDIGGLPTGVDFGPVIAPGGALRHVPVGSSGGAPLTLTSVTATPPFSVDVTGTTCTASAPVPIGGNCSVAVQVTLTGRGPVTGMLTFTGNIPGGSRTVALAANGVTVPGPPAALTVTPGDAQAVLSWLPPADDGGTALTGYQIYRSSGQQPTPMLVGTVGPATQIHTDAGLAQNIAYTYVVRAVNAAGFSPASPPAAATPVPGLAVTTASLADATADVGYSLRLQAAGGIAPYRWSVDGTLPSGLVLDPDTGELSGTPMTAGGFAFTVRVADSATPAREADRALTLTVRSAPTPAEPAPSAAGPGDTQAGRTPAMDGDDGDGGSDAALWAWALLGVVGVIGAIVAIRRLRAARAGTRG
ncbi:putative Ig domain-containing protein [Yinghuangia sp. YIM S10712]|uniref:putative Ig domain-containing protein n=1 Tax=Yinghuangia sp. YIM S10712 TaxID=3436930 RepID=UPI003F538037